MKRRRISWRRRRISVWGIGGIMEVVVKHCMGTAGKS